MHVIVAPLAATLITVNESEGRAIVASGNDALVFRNDSSVSSLHTIRARRGKLSQSHEVSVEGRSDKLRILEFVFRESRMEVKQVICLILEAFSDEMSLLRDRIVERVLISVELNLVIQVDEILQF